ncbi:pilus assembly protein Flp/PilA [Anaerovibrio lipolyticus DSM 3074]|uniref:Pilin n=2 Tax=Anaerovibrio lipolyticus TaxID=82374 RepID=A0A0B2K117_9FIRM|nr:hypothetical protein [Anaerovibrio lipolyticus]KHM52623.1 hypothetical protein NZ47_03660 [Anaerovibrio lipolyticus]SHI29900.1 pilus assembly protein Flp/PilA [Anaerovibrio lipolyticus DSM 3074]
MKVMRYLEQKGQGIVEYALILAFVVAIAAGLTNAGGIKDKVSAIFTQVGNTLDTAKNNSTTTTNP